MPRVSRFALVVLSILVMLPGILRAAQAKKPAPEETLTFEDFGVVHVYRESPHPPNVVLFISGDGGWTAGVANMARNLASLDSLVVGFDITHFLRAIVEDGEKCSYFAWSLEDLSHFTQQKLGYPRYVFPILVGYSSGATLAYAALVQSHTGTFRGAISLGFCPDLLLGKSPCRGDGLQWTVEQGKQKTRWEKYVFRPAPKLVDPWIVLHGDIDQVCDPKSAAAFVKESGSARIVRLPKVGHGFSVEPHWMPQLKAEFSSLVHALAERSEAPKAPEVEDLPLVEVPAANSSSDALAVIISGDGGWASIDRDLGKMLADSGVSVVGVNSLQYFWTRRTPETAAADLDRVLRHYLAAWNKRRVVLAGYSMGADVLSFMTARLPQDLLSKVALIALLGPSTSIDFEFHFTDWFSEVRRGTDLRVAPEIEKLRGKQILCFFGTEEEDNLCKLLPAGLVRLEAMKDGHHYGGDYRTIAEIILKELR
jgi:type IV secretory pathway VirJ component